MGASRAAAWLLVLLPAAFAAVKLQPEEQPQQSYPYSLPPGQNATNDLSLDEPPLARTVTGFEPEGINLILWGPTSVLISWSTGEPLIGNNTDPPLPYNASAVRSVVRWGTAPGSLTEETEQDHRLVYEYNYGPEQGDTTYQSPILHHVLLRDLKPGTTVYYTVGDEEHGWSEEASFKLPGGYPVRVCVVGDLGETANSTQTVAGLIDAQPDVVVNVGDYTYANDHNSDNPGEAKTNGGDIGSYQPRWDAWARMTQPLFSRVPFVGTGGNHEIELLLTNDNATNTAVNARYPMPQEPDADELMTGPNFGVYYLDYLDATPSAPVHFKNESDFLPQSGYFSVDLPGVHIISLHSYLPWGEQSHQYRWLKKDLAAVDRKATPFVIVYFHASIYHSYVQQYMQADTFRTMVEPLFVEHAVDLVFAGHVHSYERTYPVVNYTRDDCGPVYVTIGDGGNLEGLSQQFIDEPPAPSYCNNTAKYALPDTQPINRPDAVITLQDGQFCPEFQPEWSAFREASFGFGVLDILNETHATWEWKRNAGLGGGQVDKVTLVRVPEGTCGGLAPAPTPAPTTGPASGAARWMALPGWLLLAGLLALPAGWLLRAD